MQKLQQICSKQSGGDGKQDYSEELADNVDASLAQ